MNTLVTRLVVTMIVATFVFVPARVGAQEKTASKPRVDFRFNSDQPTSLRAPLLTAARATAVRAQKVPHRKMSTVARIAIGAAIGFSAGMMCGRGTGCGVPDSALAAHEQNDFDLCTWSFVGMIAGGGVIGYFAGR